MSNSVTLEDFLMRSCRIKEHDLGCPLIEFYFGSFLPYERNGVAHLIGCSFFTKTIDDHNTNNYFIYDTFQMGDQVVVNFEVPLPNPKQDWARVKLLEIVNREFAVPNLFNQEQLYSVYSIQRGTLPNHDEFLRIADAKNLRFSRDADFTIFVLKALT